jgi:hypothetical protein
MWPTLRYAWLTLRHKLFVFIAGRRLSVPLWRLVVHDLSKFTPYELPHYGRQFFGDRSDPLGFARAWLHHQNLNDHHWEYWIPRTAHMRSGFPDGEPLPMPEEAVREMVADWVGASRAYDGAWPTLVDWPWMRTEYPKVRLHPETRALVEAVLEEIQRG